MRIGKAYFLFLAAILVVPLLHSDSSAGSKMRFGYGTESLNLSIVRYNDFLPGKGLYSVSETSMPDASLTQKLEVHYNARKSLNFVLELLTPYTREGTVATAVFPYKVISKGAIQSYERHYEVTIEPDVRITRFMFNKYIDAAESGYVKLGIGHVSMSVHSRTKQYVVGADGDNAVQYDQELITNLDNVQFIGGFGYDIHIFKSLRFNINTTVMSRVNDEFDYYAFQGIRYSTNFNELEIKKYKGQIGVDSAIVWGLGLNYSF